MRTRRWLALGLLLLPLGGCDAFLEIIDTNQTSVRLVNTASFPVTVELYFGDDQNTLRALLVEFGTERNITIPPGETRSFTEPCEELQAIVIEDANLDVLGAIGPSNDTDVLRDGSDFGCGDTIVYTFSGGLLPLGLNIEETVED
jgi:hypothetical protein